MKVYHSEKGLANSIRYLLKRNEIPVSVYHYNKVYGKRTEGMFVEEGINTIKIEPYRCDFSIDKVLEVLKQEGFKIEKIDNKLIINVKKEMLSYAR